MEDSYGGYSGGGGGKKAAEGEDLEEEQVWEMVNARESPNSVSKTKGCNEPPSSSTVAWREKATSGGEESFPPRRAARPVNIPNSAKIVKVDDDEEEEEEEERAMVAPHEYLATRSERNRASHSMCEGVGRTLKGRDLTKLRNHILTKTGFIE